MTTPQARSLDEKLQTRQGPVRTFLILARYASRTVYDEQLERLRLRGSVLWPPNLVRFAAAWWRHARTELKLGLFERWLWCRKVLGMRAVQI